jgi:hypothetical protein
VDQCFVVHTNVLCGPQTTPLHICCLRSTAHW